jgi:hypothetical protein
MSAAAAAAVVAAAVVEPPVLAVVDLARLPVLALAQVVARRAHRVQRPLLARLPVLAKVPLPAPALRSVVVARAHLPVLARVLVVAHLVVAPAVPLRLLSRQSFSAATARNTP